MVYISRKVLTTNERDRASSATYQRERNRRIYGMWRRFYPEARAMGLAVEWTSNVDSQLRYMWWAVRKHKLLAFTPQNVLEAADLGLDDDFEPVPCQPSCIPQGKTKLMLFAARVEAGEELFHERDGELQ